MQWPVIIIVIVLMAIGAFVINMPDGQEMPKGLDGGNDQTEVQGNDNGAHEVIGPTLDLSGQGLDKAPSYIFDQQSLVYLNLSHNSLTGALPAEIRFLSRLKVLDLSDNQFTGVPAEVGQLKYLEELDLSNNQLTGLPHELGNLKNLQKLDLRGNQPSEFDLKIIRDALPNATILVD